MSHRDPAVVVIGATGYTGRLIARELAEKAGAEAVVLAARDPRRLAPLAEELGVGTTQAVDVVDPSSLAALIRAGDVVINTAGPFTQLGEPVVRACVDIGAHYLDTTGEQPFMHAIYRDHHEAARARGVSVVNAMAFEYALGDCAVAVLAEELDATLTTLDVIYAWGGVASSMGTRRTVLRMLGQKAWVRAGAEFHREALGARRRRVAFGSGRRLHAVSFGAGEVVTVPRYLEVENARGWMVMGGAAARVIPLVARSLPFVMPLVRPVLEPLVTRKPDPTSAERGASGFTIRVEASAGGPTRALEVHGADPYGITAAAIVRGALRARDPQAPRGVLAPAELLDPAEFLETLDPPVRLVRDPLP